MKLNEDWSDFSDDDLNILTQKIADELALRAHKRKAIEEISQNLKKLGLSVQDLIQANSSKGKKLPIKYADPDNSNNVWTGRGHRPTWLKEAIAKGKSLDSFKV